MLGFKTNAEAQAAYEAGFSDGSGASRKGAVTAMKADEFDAAIKDPAKWKGPLSYSKAERDKRQAIDKGLEDNRKAAKGFKKGDRVEWTDDGFTPPRKKAGTIHGVSSKDQGTFEVKADGSRTGDGYDVTVGAAKLRPEAKAEPKAEASDNEIVTVKDAYGDTHRVRKSDLDGSKPMLRRYKANGDPVDDGIPLNRANIDTDGSKVTATYADQNIIGSKTGDKPLKNKASIRKAIKDRGQNVDEFEIRQVEGGFLGVRKSALKEDARKDQNNKKADPAQRLKNAKAQFNTLDGEQKISDVKAYMAASSELSDARDAFAEDLASKGGRIELKNDSGMGAAITPMGDGFQITYFDKRGMSGDTQHKTLKAAVKDAVGQGYDQVASGYMKELMSGKDWTSPTKVEEVRKQVEGGETTPKADISKEKKAKIEDLGEKIGGARKDTSAPTGPRAAKPKDERPASQRRYEVNEIAADAFNKSRVGKFTISDTRSKSGRIPGFMRGQLDFDTREAAEAAIPFIAVSRNHRVMKAGDDFAIVRQVSDRKRPVVKGGFETRDDAMKYMAENAEEIAETKLRIDDSIHPALEEAIRVGEQRRENDRDVAGQDFMDIFGFRGVEFGNWNNNAERQHLLNQAFDAFLDLAEITDMPPKALSLHGEMALAFGARGHGLQGARAHYERNYGVINLTKIKGAGSLAHEWFHAMDHYFARQDGSAKPRNPNAAEGEPIYDAKTPKEDYVSHGFLYKSGMREEIRNEIKNLMAAIMKRKAEYTEDQSSRERISERQIEQVNTHLERIEGVLSTEQRYGKKKAPATEEQMQRFKKAAAKIRSGKDLGEKTEAPTKARFSTFLFYEPVMEIAEVYKEVRGRQAYGQTQGRKSGYAVDLQNAIEVRNQAQQFLDDAKAEKVKEKTVRSEFYSEAWKIDQGTSKDYWSTNHELAARAFESYVYDRLQDIDARNDFLAYEKHNNLPQYKLFNVKPYPEGQERKDINAAFERLFSVIQSKEDADSVMLYQRPLDMFYSPLLKAVSSAKQVKAPAKDWKAIVAKLPGVKKAELEWLGVEEWLDSQEGQQVPREALVAFIRDSQIEVVEERQTEDWAKGLDDDDIDEALGDSLPPEPDFRIETSEADWPDSEFFQQEAEIYLDEAREELEADGDPEDVTDESVMERAVEMAEERYEPSTYQARLYNYEDDSVSGVPQEYDGYYDSYMGTYFFPELDDGDLGESDAIRFANSKVEEAIENLRTEYVESAEEKRKAEEAEYGYEITGRASFSDYTETGGDHYREVLLRVPNLHEIGKNRTDKSAASQWEKFNQDILDDLSQPTIGRPMVESPNVQRPKSPFVQSSHFEQENIVVHARVKDRKGADGEKVLFVEEIQSDLASKWRESTEAPEVTERRRELKQKREQIARDLNGAQGRIAIALSDYFAEKNVTDATTAANKIRYRVEDRAHGGRPLGDEFDQHTDALRETDLETYQRIVELSRERDKVNEELIGLGTEKKIDPYLPDTPFKEEHTYTLMVKRLLREAAENGYDRLSWTPGYMQAERWNSAAQNVVEGVNWEPGESEGFESHRYVNLEMADRGQTITAVVDDKGLIYGAAGNAELEGKPLSALIGPSLAKQIMAQPEGSVSGQKITFSDSGYAIAYDQQVKRAVDKFAKKYGARVEVDKSLPDFKKFYGQEAGGVLDAITNFGFDEFVRKIEESVPNDKAESFAFSASRARGDMERGNESEAYSNIRIAAINAVGREKILDIIGYQNEGNPVWSIDITPELREAAMEPMSLFRRGADYKGATAATLRKELPALRAQLNKMGLKDVNLRLAKPDSEYQGALRIDRKGGMTMLIGASLDPANTINHEAIHALRAMDLFTEKEWDTLSEAAEGWMQKHSIAERYPDLSKLGQIEEAIAEEYAAWDGKGSGPFAKIKNFLQALGNFLRGKGFQTVDDIYGKVASGEVGRRGSTDAEFRGGGVDPAVTEDDVRALTKDMNAELKQSGLAGKVSVRVVKRLVSLTSGNEILGRFEADKGITVRAAGGVDERGIMRHEIIHALRSPTLWNTSHGLFTPAEWRGLVRAARADKGIRDNVLGRYADQPAAMQSEEMVAEMYRLWAADRDSYSGVETALAKIEAFLGALANLLRGRGFNSAAMTMQRIASGQVGGRGPTSPGGARGAAMATQGAEMRAPAGAVREKFKGLVGSDHWKDPQGFISNKLSDAMAGKGDYSLLALVPGRPLFAELGKRLTAAQSYLKHKENMDQTRNDWHSRADTVSQRWLKARNKDPRANDTLMDLMHRTTLAQVDPTQAYDGSDATWAKKEVARHGEHAPDWAHRKVAEDQRRRKSHRVMREIYEALPPAFQKLYKDIRAEYDAMGDDFEAAVLENVKHSMRVALKRARKEHRKAMQSIKDDGLTGREKADAVAEADEALRKAEQRNEKGAASKLQSLRAQFESNRLTGPYFPLARFGDYFVTVRDDDDQVISFAQFETEAKQQVHIKEMEAKHPGKVQHGLMNKKGALRDQVNPTFVADVEAMLADAEVDDQVLDAIWQRWLSTMPDQSIRTSKIHRKGRAGWNEDAFRAFGKHMFHGAHQLARLKHGVLLEESLDDARDEARVAANPNRAGALVNEMEKRHEFTMNPTGSSVVASMSSLAFLWYLGASPAAAIVNISQTTIVGTPIMAARFTKAGVNGSLSAITKAAKDFGRGKGHVENSANLSADEKKAMAEAYQRGTIDKTQAHDLASVAETGIEYNAHREKWMRRIGWFFHNAERMNREVTFLANYRLARADGLSHAEAVDVGADMTWKIHFDYQNCVDEDTECLTTTGWKRHDALKPGDRIMSVDDMGQAVEIGLQEINVFHRPQEIMLMSAKGKDRHFSMAMTPDHKCVIQRQTKEAGRRRWAHVEFIEAQNLKPSQALLRIPSAPLDRQGSVGEDMAALLGWFTSEGWFSKNRGAKEKNNVRIEQSLTHNPEYVEEIDGILNRLGASFSRHETKNGNHILWSLSGDVAQKVKGLVPDKMLTWDMVSSWSAEEMSACMDAFCKGDGTRRGKNGAWTIQQKASTNRQNLDVLQAMATSTGRLASIGESNTRDVAWLLLGGDGPTKGTRTQVKEMDVSTIQVPMVWCPTTDNGRWIARRNGRVFVTGNTARPRFMQNDLGKILTTFRQFTVNMLYRMFRDAHQALNGATETERREARAQLLGITLSMMAHAGIKGTWGYGIAMGLLALFLPGDSDDLEDWMQDALLMEGDDPATAAWNFAMGAALNGAPGQITGANLTERLGMPNLWFRGPGRELEGRDVYAHYVKELLGPVYGIGEGVVRGGFAVAEGDVVRGAESMIPKFIRDIVKTGRYAADGVETWNGDPIVEDVNPWELLLQANGFTPARVAERYEINNRLKNRERKIMDERKDIHKAASDAIAAGGPIPEKVMDMVRDFNKRFPEYPITGQTIKQSFRGRQRAKQRNEFGISLNPKLNARLRSEVTQPVYN
ncbi:PLxRFG domain-containing protein [Sulfitobacter sp. 915]|uniref:PLxRFG domain-containing protein n=1 Tax=Sulfitobacter sp. 915 TaxID=3368558 RepID=UPI0037474D9A